MTTGQLYRLSGLALLVGAVLSIVSSVGSGVLFPDNNAPGVATNPLNIALGVVGVLGTVAALLGLPGLYARSAREGGSLWLIGVALIAITGLIFGIFLGMMSVFVIPVLASRAPDLFGDGPPPSFFVLFILGTLTNFLGALLMGIPMLTRRLYPRWCGWLMVAEAVLAVLGFVVNGPSASGLLSTILNVISPLPLFVVIGYIGYVLWSSRGAPAEAAGRAVVPQPA
jgi:hypothetical protein